MKFIPLMAKSVLRLRDEVLSIVRLADIFKVDSVLENTNEVYVVVIGLAEQKMGVIVDYLVGQRGSCYQIAWLLS